MELVESSGNAFVMETAFRNLKCRMMIIFEIIRLVRGLIKSRTIVCLECQKASCSAGRCGGPEKLVKRIFSEGSSRRCGWSKEAIFMRANWSDSCCRTKAVWTYRSDVSGCLSLPGNVLVQRVFDLVALNSSANRSNQAGRIESIG